MLILMTFSMEEIRNFERKIIGNLTKRLVIEEEKADQSKYLGVNIRKKLESLKVEILQKNPRGKSIWMREALKRMNWQYRGQLLVNLLGQHTDPILAFGVSNLSRKCDIRKMIKLIEKPKGRKAEI